jgi:hypothetical protein
MTAERFAVGLLARIPALRTIRTSLCIACGIRRDVVAQVRNFFGAAGLPTA